MPLVADRFLTTEDDVVDLATGEAVCLTIERAARTATRAALCDRLFAVRHPLLRPLVDYGACADGWFEAHASLPALHCSGIDARTSALHLVRFLRSCGIELDAAAAARNVRPAIDTASGGHRRPVGVRLQPRRAFDTVRTVLESTGPPGVTELAVCGSVGTGLRTARVQIARAARLAGYLVADSRFGALDELLVPARHVCVIDWLSRETSLPPLLALASSAGARRHVWIRFCRHPAGAGSVGLEPLMTRELTSAIYLDPESGPTAAEVRAAIDGRAGLPGALIEALSNRRGTEWRAVSWVHESAPGYAVNPRVAPAVARPASGGVARLQRAVEAADALVRRGRHARAARVLERCAGALAARGAEAEAAGAGCALGELYLDRGRPADAFAAFQRAQGWAKDGAFAARAMIGSGRALLEQGRIADAEGLFRTACLADRSPQASARRWLAEALMLRGRIDAAEDALGEADSALLSVIARLHGDLAGAARAATRAIAAAGEDAEAGSAAHLAMAQVQAAMGSLAAVREHAAAAEAFARAARSPARRLRVAAEVLACLEQCGVRNPAMRDRLLRAAKRLPVLSGACIRAALHAATLEDAAIVSVAPRSTDLIHCFRALVTVIHDAPDEPAALQGIAIDLHSSLDACSVVIRSAVLGSVVASAGRTWNGEETVTRAVLDGAGTLLDDGATPSAAEPILAGASILGALAVRWVRGARPPVPRVRDVLRTAAVAAAPLLRTLHIVPKGPVAPEASYPDELLGPGPSAERVRDAIRRAAIAPYPVLIEGESGSGKELVARAIHARSARRARKLCAVNCAALADDLLEAELFGHARGAFTGAVSERPGLFEEADQGTLFLDEAAELTPRAQAKLLRVLQEGEIRRVGENMARRIDTRVVAATNRPLDAEVRAGRFRADLRFRLDVIRIVIPPLRDRPDDVPWLVERIWREAAARVGTRATLGPEVVGALARYDWPGNVRELQNVIAALAVHGPRRGRLPAALLPVHIAGATVKTARIEDARDDFERRFVRAALARAGGRRSRAAAQLGVTRQGLAKIIKRLGIVES
ncbi:MAG TPA: sigma 54-interacting transcriptional regulator [Vicinamibacterales bacterium]|nr:sigma 54-interacting transcriptional regulator [Vicinamibacterales bacterium]